MNLQRSHLWYTGFSLLLLAVIYVAASFNAAGVEERVQDGHILQSTSKAFSEVAKKSIPAVVFIQVEKSVTVSGRYHDPARSQFNDPFDFFGDEFLRRFFGYHDFRRPSPRQFRQMGQGSGFIISKDGYILTNNHVVGDVDKITVRLHDGREFEAKLIGTDPHSEVAVIKIDGDGLPVLTLGDSNEMEIGEWVIAVGNPFGLSETLTVGVVSAKGRSNIGITDYENFIQTDAAINPGNSGGPLLNINGEAIGINTAIYSRSGGYMGIGFAIPINMARGIKDQLVKTGKVERGFIGIIIQPVNASLARSFGLEEPEGILVAGVAEGSAGERAGLEQGDIILKLNGKKVGDVSAFRNDIASTPPGTELDLHIVRDNRARDIKVKIGALHQAQGQERREDEITGNDMGLAVEDLTSELARRFGYEVGEGVMVSQVEAGSAADRASIKPGYLITNVNRNPVTSVKEFQEALSKSETSKIVLLLVTDGNFSRYAALNLEQSD